MQPEPLFSTAFDELAIGDRFVTPSRTVTEADVVSFASLTGDRHPQHVDAQWAKESAFGERIAHGLLVLSYAIGLVPFDPDRVIALRRISDAVFKRPARIGDTISMTGTVDAIKPVDARQGLVGCDCRISNQDANLLIRARFELLWACGPPAARTISPAEPDVWGLPI